MGNHFMINIINGAEGWEVWTYNDTGEGDGRCVGCNPDKRAAVNEAYGELHKDLEKLSELLRDPNLDLPVRESLY